MLANALAVAIQYSECTANLGISVYHISMVITYWTLIVRDIVLVSLSLYYTRKTCTNVQLADKDAEQEDYNSLTDFEMMLTTSMLPHKYFAIYLQQEQPEFQPYLQMIHKVRIISEESQQLDEKILLAKKAGEDEQAVLQREIERLKGKIAKREKQALKLAQDHKQLFLERRKESLAAEITATIKTRVADSKNFFSGSLNANDDNETESPMDTSTFELPEAEPKLSMNEQHQLEDLEHLYWKSFNSLEQVFNGKFKTSKSFKDLVLLMNQNMVEYKFMR
jgi:hypothetical protein